MLKQRSCQRESLVPCHIQPNVNNPWWFTLIEKPCQNRRKSPMDSWVNSFWVFLSLLLFFKNFYHPVNCCVQSFIRQIELPFYHSNLTTGTLKVECKLKPYRFVRLSFGVYSAQWCVLYISCPVWHFCHNKKLFKMYDIFLSRNNKKNSIQ